MNVFKTVSYNFLSVYEGERVITGDMDIWNDLSWLAAKVFLIR